MTHVKGDCTREGAPELAHAAALWSPSSPQHAHTWGASGGGKRKRRFAEGMVTASCVGRTVKQQTACGPAWDSSSARASSTHALGGSQVMFYILGLALKMLPQRVLGNSACPHMRSPCVHTSRPLCPQLPGLFVHTHGPCCPHLRGLFVHITGRGSPHLRRCGLTCFGAYVL